MWQRNDGKGADSILQNQFTAYLVTAVHRKKIQYLQTKSRRLQNELPLNIEDNRNEFQVEPDMMPNLPLFDKIESSELQQALKHLKERELHILSRKVLDDRTFQEIADETGLGYKTISSIYYRLTKRLREELGGEEE